jgi:hypothetical protein
MKQNNLRSKFVSRSLESTVPVGSIARIDACIANAAEGNCIVIKTNDGHEACRRNGNALVVYLEKS